MKTVLLTVIPICESPKEKKKEQNIAFIISVYKSLRKVT